MSVIDIGDGASRLVDTLLVRGQDRVSILDLSAAALATARARIGDDASVTWIVSDVTRWVADRA
jgi:predicted RNA methylase